MKNTKISTGTKAVLLFINFAVMADMVVTPVVTGFMESFPNATSMQIDMFLTYPTLFSVVGAVVCGALTQRISKKRLLSATLFVFMLASCCGVLINNINYILCMRLIVGFSYGMVTPLGTGLIAELFTEENERASMLGAFNGVGTLFGAAMSFASGYVGMINWRYSFYIYLISVPVFILVLFLIPNTPPEGKQSEAADTVDDRTQMPWMAFLPIVIAFLVYNILYSILLYYVGIYVDEAGLGDANVASIITVCIQLAMFAMGMGFAKVYGKIGRKLPIFIFVVSAISFIGLSYASAAVIAYVFALLSGLAYGATVNYYQIKAMEILPESKMTFGLGIIGTGLGLGGILSSFARQLYLSVFSLETTAQLFFYLGVTFLALGVLAVITFIRYKAKGQSAENAQV